MSVTVDELGVDLDELREAIREEYAMVAANPTQDFHFHTGRPLTALLNYDPAWLDKIPEKTIEAFAGTGNPFSMGILQSGENVVDVGSGGGIDSFIAANMVGPTGAVIGVDMTPEMLKRARQALAEADQQNVTFEQGYGETLPIPDGWADVVISNGVLNLMPNKEAALREMARVLKPNGRIQLADILVEKAVSNSGKQNIDLWTG
ncbi:MAG: methyltransferase domain-containing protein [Anaerolineales bacterium]|nr:methyltransferase domain-containing protein [Anaerolineales bacterium]